METSLTYTQSEFDFLCQSISAKFDKGVAKELSQAIHDLHSPEVFQEQLIHKKYLDQEVTSLLRNNMPFGEAKVFVLYYEGRFIEFNFCTRHLKTFLYKTQLREMPLLINTYFINVLASWRLKIAK